MANRKPSFNRSDVKAAWKLLELAGEEPVSIRVEPNGTFSIITKKYAEMAGLPLAKAEVVNPWDTALAGDGPAQET